MPHSLYSIRMHASREDRHLSGAERIVSANTIDAVLQTLVARAMGKTEDPDRVVVTIEGLGERPLLRLAALDVVTIDVHDEQNGRSCAQKILEQAGVSLHAARTALMSLAQGPSPDNKVMRGAVLMDAASGDRLEPDPMRGVRVSRFDWEDSALSRVRRCLESVGLTHSRTWEALALATKVASTAGIIAELCWSDDPDYTAGYVASRTTGYVRFPYLKKAGDKRGGRVFFVDRKQQDTAALIRYLETEAVLIHDGGSCLPALSFEDYCTGCRPQDKV